MTNPEWKHKLYYRDNLVWLRDKDHFPSESGFQDSFQICDRHWGKDFGIFSLSGSATLNRGSYLPWGPTLECRPRLNVVVPIIV
jgi:hypothetical protein